MRSVYLRGMKRTLSVMMTDGRAIRDRGKAEHRAVRVFQRLHQSPLRATTLCRLTASRSAWVTAKSCPHDSDNRSLKSLLWIMLLLKLKCWISRRSIYLCKLSLSVQLIGMSYITVALHLLKYLNASLVMAATSAIIHKVPACHAILRHFQMGYWAGSAPRSGVSSARTAKTSSFPILPDDERRIQLSISHDFTCL